MSNFTEVKIKRLAKMLIFINIFVFLIGSVNLYLLFTHSYDDNISSAADFEYTVDNEEQDSGFGIGEAIGESIAEGIDAGFISAFLFVHFTALIIIAGFGIVNGRKLLLLKRSGRQLTIIISFFSMLMIFLLVREYVEILFYYFTWSLVFLLVFYLIITLYLIFDKDVKNYFF